MRKSAVGPAPFRRVLARGTGGARSRLTVLGVLIAVLSLLSAVVGATAVWAAATSQLAASPAARHAVAADEESKAERIRCTTRAGRVRGPNDHQVKSAQEHERATTRRALDHQVAGAAPEVGGIAPPSHAVGDAPQPVEDRYCYRPYRTVDGRAPPRVTD
ncbi:MAG: hypothetical protein GEU97_06475 [Actinophytocola sp.]|nr:hypothetical protein [Actinophytocola sp.]